MNTNLARLNRSPVRWFIVGSLTFFIDTSIFMTAFYITNHAIGSNLFSGLIATTFNYFSHYHWSFASDRKHHQSTAIYIFFFFAFLIAGTSIINFLIERDVMPLFAKVGTAAIIAPISFFIMKFVTFRKNGDA
jgi:putative flippase GtrA